MLNNATVEINRAQAAPIMPIPGINKKLKISFSKQIDDDFDKYWLGQTIDFGGVLSEVY